MISPQKLNKTIPATSKGNVEGYFDLITGRDNVMYPLFYTNISKFYENL